MQHHTLPCELMISLDCITDKEAFDFLSKIGHNVEWVRVTNQLFFPYGVALLQQLSNYGYKIFLDIRLSDTPLSMAASILSLHHQPIDQISVQLIQGLPSLQFAQTALKQSLPNAQLVATTLLYHLHRYETLPKIFNHLSKNLMNYYYRLAVAAKIYHVMCTAYEFPFLLKHFGAHFTYTIYGSELNETQERYPFFKMAKRGAKTLILGESCLKQKDPEAYILKIREEIAQALVTSSEIYTV
ncbi:MAG: orotidine 5'-phosphate decarboxylase [Puniceicoccales bacterium]|nr:orotidine 5'-phosphate decarboxylase [Puniceicoccales bacterium]